MRKKMTSLFVVVCVLAATLGAPEASARTGRRRSRQGKWDVYLAWQRLGDDSSDISMDYLQMRPTSISGTLELDDSDVFGIGVGYNITDHFNVNSTFTYGTMRMETKDFDDAGDEQHYFESRDSHDIITGDLNLDYYLLADTFTPMLTGGIGFMNVSGDFDDIDTDEVEDFDVEGTNFTYNFGGGLRWDITERAMLKCVYKSTWTKLDNTDDRVRMDGWAINLGVMF